MFKKIDDSLKSWILGLVYCSNSVKEEKVIIQTYYSDSDVLTKISRCLSENQYVINKDSLSASLEIKDDILATDILNYLKVINNISDVLNVVQNEKLVYDFIRGIFDVLGHQVSNNQVYFRTNNEEFSKSIVDFIGIPCGLNEEEVFYKNCNALDFLGKIYYDGVYFKSERKYEQFIRMCTYDITDKTNIKDLKIHVVKAREDAVIPGKSRISDSGYDLTLLSLEKKIGEVELYDTGIKIVPPFGYYFDVVPRSSIIKSGYMLANNVGIIDRTYLGNIKIPLIKVDKNAKDLECPVRLVQLIPRKIQHFEIVESNEDDIGTTNRGSGGFGSTGR